MGLPRHASRSTPGGMVIATRPLIDVCPVVPAAMEGRQIVQWSRTPALDAGFLKIDLLGLGMLSAVERCVDGVGRTRPRDPPLDLSRIDFKDKTFESIQRAETTGVFQIESRAQMQMLPRTLPENLDDLTLQVALVRPGPIQGGAVHPYIERRMRRREDPEFPIPYRAPAAGESAGGHARHDRLPGAGARSGQGAGRLLLGAGGGAAPGDEPQALRSGDRAPPRALRRGGRGQGRRRGDRAAGLGPDPGLLGLRLPEGALGRLRPARLPVGLAAGASRPGVPLRAAQRAADGLRPARLPGVHEAQRRGVRVVRPDANRGGVLCRVERERGGLVVRVGLGYVKGVREEEMESLVAARESGAPYSGIADLASRSGAGRDGLERLAWAGALDEIAASVGEGAARGRREALWQVGVAPHATRAGTAGEGAQLALPLEPPEPPALAPLGGWEAMIADYRSTGMTLGEHPLAMMRLGLDPRILRSTDLAAVADGSEVEVAGMVVARQRPETAKGIVFMLLEDERGVVNLIVPPPVYERHRALVRAAPLARARGRLERREGVVNILVSETPRAAGHAERRKIHAPVWKIQRSAESAVPTASSRSPSCAPSRPPAIAGAAARAELSFSEGAHRRASSGRSRR